MITSNLYKVIGLEAFVSIHMSLFVLKPLSEMLSKKNPKKLFWIMFAIRAAILLFFDFRGNYEIFMVDFFGVFLGAFILVPIIAAITKTKLNRRSNQVIKNNEDHYINNTNSNSFAGDYSESNNLDTYNFTDNTNKSYVDNTNGHYVDSDRYLNATDDDINQNIQKPSNLIQKCDVCGKKSELSYTYCPYCGAFLLGDIVSDTVEK